MQCSQFWAAIEMTSRRSSGALFILYYRVVSQTADINLFVGEEPAFALLLTSLGVSLAHRDKQCPRKRSFIDRDGMELGLMEWVASVFLDCMNDHRFRGRASLYGRVLEKTERLVVLFRRSPYLEHLLHFL